MVLNSSSARAGSRAGPAARMTSEKRAHLRLSGGLGLGWARWRNL